MKYIPDEAWRNNIARRIGVESVQCRVQDSMLVLSFAKGDMFYAMSWALPDGEVLPEVYTFGWVKLAHHAAVAGKKLEWV